MASQSVDNIFYGTGAVWIKAWVTTPTNPVVANVHTAPGGDGWTQFGYQADGGIEMALTSERVVKMVEELLGPAMSWVNVEGFTASFTEEEGDLAALGVYAINGTYAAGAADAAETLSIGSGTTPEAYFSAQIVLVGTGGRAYIVWLPKCTIDHTGPGSATKNDSRQNQITLTSISDDSLAAGTDLVHFMNINDIP